MKKIIRGHTFLAALSFVMVAVCILSTVMSAAAQETMDVFKLSYKYESGELRIEGTSSLKYKEYVFVAVVPKGQMPSESDLYHQIAVQNDGSFASSVKIDPELSVGEYDVYISNTNLKSMRTLILPDSAKMKEVLSVVNSGSAADIEGVFANSETVRLLAMDRAFVDDNRLSLASYIYSRKPSGGYDAEHLINTYISALCSTNMRQSKGDIAALLQRYSDYLGISYEKDYDMLSQKAKEQIAALARSSAISSDRPFAEYYGELSFMAQAKTCTSYEKLMEYIEKQYTVANLDMSDYNLLGNKYKQQEIFRSLFREMNGIDTFSALNSKFTQLVRDAGKESGTGGMGGAGSGGSGGSGSGSSGGGTAGIGSVKMDNMDNNAPVSDGIVLFTDMQNHWAANEISELYHQAVISGYEDNTFRPDNTVTRAEFVQMICNGINAVYNGADMFEDVGRSDWYFKSVNTAAELEIVKGFGNRFEPEDFITRQDAAVILYSVFQYRGIVLEGQESFADDDKIASYAYEGVSTLAGNGIVQGYGGYYAPEDNLTRAEAGVLVYRLLNYSVKGEGADANHS